MKHVSKKYAFLVLSLMACLYFFSFFQRVAVPGTIFNDLQSDLAASAAAITALSSIYLYVYAGMQMFVGMLADKYGGIKIILISGLLLCAGSLLFPLGGSLWVTYLSRALIGFGASGMFLCIIKETDTFFGGKNFAPMLGLLCVIGYAGGLFGTRPFRALVDAAGWRQAMLWVGAATVATLVVTWLAGRKIAAPAGHERKGGMLGSLVTILKTTHNYPLVIFGSINFSIYFCIQATIGPKFLGDFLGVSPQTATSFTFTMMMFTMVMIFMSSIFSRMAGNRRKVFIIASSLTTLAAVLMFLIGITTRQGPAFFLTAFILLAVSAGCATLVSATIRELNHPDATALSIGFVNTTAYVSVAVLANLIGIVLDVFKSRAVVTDKAVLYPAEAYTTLFLILLALAAASVVAAAKNRETMGKNVYGTLS